MPRRSAVEASVGDLDRLDAGLAKLENMRILYIPAAVFEHDRKLERIAKRPFTTHSISDFLQDIAYLEGEIRSHPGLRRVSGAPSGFFRVGPSPIYSYSLIYRLRDGDAYIIAVAAPGRRPLYWAKRES